MQSNLPAADRLVHANVARLEFAQEWFEVLTISYLSKYPVLTFLVAACRNSSASVQAIMETTQHTARALCLGDGPSHLK